MKEIIMISLIPAVKDLKINEGKLQKKALSFDANNVSARLAKALAKLPVSDDGANLYITYGVGKGEGYVLKIAEDSVTINAGTEAGAFYAIQTLRQIFENEEIPCLEIHDKPDFEYRGFYHDVTRGKVATVETLKGLIDTMAY